MTDPLDRIDLFDDSEEVAEGVASIPSDGEYPYWQKEGRAHILGLWELCKELAEEVRRLRKIDQNEDFA